MLTDTEIAKLRKDWREHIPDKHNGAYRRTWDKAMAHKGFKAAVTAKCQDCACWVKAEITNCQVYCCPLWEYRPYQQAKRPNPASDTQ